MPQIQTREDIRNFEKTPIEEQQLPGNTYAFLERGAAYGEDRKALSFFLQAKGDAFKNSETYTYGELLANIRQCANMFRDLGIEKDDVVSFVLPNLPETHFTIWGAECAGIVNPINPLLEPAVIKDILNAAGCKVLVTINAFPNTDLWEKIEQIRADIPTLKTVLRINLEDHLSGLTKLVIKGITLSKRSAKNVSGQQVLDFNKLRKKYPKDKFTFNREILPSDTASYFHTGGTTGVPKLARHTHANEVFDSWSALQMLGGENPELNFFCGLPLFHVNGVMVTGLGPWGQGAHVVLGTPSGYRGEGVIPNFWEIIEHYKVNFFSGVPTVYSTLLNYPLKGADVSSLDYALCGAAPMPVEIFRQFEKLTNVKILEGYGCTEGTCVSSANPPSGERRVGSIGFPIPYQEMEIMILDEEGKFDRIAEADEIGIVAIRGNNVFSGYKEEIHNKGIWIDMGDGKAPFLNTGDMGRQDADGYFWLTGRKKELIIRGGHNIDPKLIEDPLAEHPAVAMAAAVGRPDPRVGEVPVAYIKLLDGQSIAKEELLEFASQKIGERAAIPKHIHIVDELPTTAVGKIFKPDLVRREIKEVFEGELKKLPSIAHFTVSVDSHKIHGTMATIKAEAKDSTKAEALKNELRRILGNYSPKFELEVH
ncbi:MAG: acyl-CoA synthetase [Bacteroidia bacterium]|nr:acyl-CoA synthetase [Bacteroidia bacterium]